MDNNTGNQQTRTGSERPAHPFVFLVLVLPSGIMQGYLSVTLAYLYSKAGVPVAEIAALVAASLLPSVFKFLWAPLIDITLSVKKWYIIGNTVSAACIFVTGILPIKSSSLPLLNVVILVSYLVITVVTMAVNILMAHDTAEEAKGRASGYFNAGGIGGIGVGGGVGLWLAQRLPSEWMVGGALAITCLLCCFALWFVEEPPSGTVVVKIRQKMTGLIKDVWLVLKGRTGVLALLLCFLPLGTGGAGNLFAAVAKDWHASADTVALITGVTGGMITGLGCLCGGWICDQINRQSAYILFGLLQGGSAIAMAFWPHTQLMYIVWTLLYSFSNGLCFAAWSAFVLEAIGKGAAATKYNIYGGLANVPIYVMTLVDGWAYWRWSPSGMLVTEAGCAVLGIAAFFAFKALSSRRQLVSLPGPG